MERRRLQDGLVGAAVAVVVLLVAGALVLVAVTRPGSDAGPSPAASAPAPASGAAGREPPADLGDDETWLGDLVLDAGTVVAAGSLLHDVHAVARDVRAGPDGVVAGRLTVDATVPFDVVAEQLGEGIVVTRAGPDRATVERDVRVAGRTLSVLATGTVTVERGRLVVEPTSIDVGGPAFLSDAIGAVARRLVTIRHDVEGLPEGLVLQDVTVRDDGFRAELTGRGVRLTSSPAPRPTP